MKVLVFDLDDTLYDELTYVKSGFIAVAKFIEQQFNIPKELSYNFMWNSLSYERGQIFDDMLKHFSLFSKSIVRKCVSVYRLHEPAIKINNAADECLKRFSNYPIYIVTDGNKIVQKNKLVALDLYCRVNHCYITHRFSLKNAKPSPYCFLKIADREKVSNEQIIYIADNPAKDFVGIKPLGFKTIRIMKGPYMKRDLGYKYDAHLRIYSLDELTEELLESLMKATE